MKQKLKQIKKQIILIKANFATTPKPDKWVFIVGCSNSGTTLLHKLLSEHPMVGSLPKEGQYLTDQLPIAQKYGIPRLWTKKENLFRMDEHNTKIDANKIKKHWGLFYDNPNKKILLEKTTTNSARIRWLNKNFPNSYFIGVIRNGYAVAEGIERKEGHSVQDAIKHWARVNEIIHEDLSQVNNHIIINYENLVDNTTDVLNRLFMFIGLEYSGNDIPTKIPYKINDEVSTIKNMNSKSIEALSKDKIDKINNIASSSLSKWGYDIIN